MAGRRRAAAGLGLFTVGALAAACTGAPPSTEDQPESAEPSAAARGLAKYTEVRLTADLATLTNSELAMLPLLIEAADIMDDLFWVQAYGPPERREALLSAHSDAATPAFVNINYGPWDRLADNEPFIAGVGPKPPGANLYPADATRQEIEAAAAARPDAGLLDLYTMVRRDEQGELVAIPYNEMFAEQLAAAADLLRRAAELAEDEGLRTYLGLRADALLSNEYRASDMAWMDMKANTIELVIGPIETYEDRLFGAKAAFEAFVLIKDREWSERLARYTRLLPALQRGLPVDEAYKREEPGSESELNAYDAIYYAGDGNAGSKTIAINLPNDEQVQLQKGTRRLQLKNSMRAKFDHILVPIAATLLDEQQRELVTFDAFFANTMFHEVAHGLGIKNTIDGSGTVRAALQEQASALEEGKADILGLYMIGEMIEEQEWEGDMQAHMATFFASIFRSTRFGAASAHGLANLVRFNFFESMGAFTRDPATGTYRLDFARAQEATTALAERILRLQGDGDYAGVVRFVEEMGQVSPQLQADLDRLAERGIPVDIVFEQGMAVLEGTR
jgi:hypothetical protein